MKFIIIVIALLTVNAAKVTSISRSLMEEWQAFKIQYGKTYENENEEEYRRQIYLNNSRIIDEHNKRHTAGEVSFDMGMNQFGDLTFLECEGATSMNGFQVDDHYKLTKEFCVWQPPYSSLNVPDSWNWVERGAVTPVKNQKQCRACWAFSAVGALEGYHYLQTGKLVNLSEQNLIDCSQTYENHGCAKCAAIKSFLYVMGNGGIDTEESYPYIGENNTCNYNPNESGISITGCRLLPRHDEEQLKIAVAKQGPISVVMKIPSDFCFYRSGIFHTNKFSYGIANHAAVMVGYGSEKGLDYWLVKNSWDTTWGDSGYFKIARNVGNLCNISSLSSFPV